MRKIREVLRLAWGQGRSLREVAQSLGIGHTTAGDVLRRAQQAGLSWPLPEALDDAELERRLYPGNQGRMRQRPEPDWNQIDTELRRHKGSPLSLCGWSTRRGTPTVTSTRSSVRIMPAGAGNWTWCCGTVASPAVQAHRAFHRRLSDGRPVNPRGL
jgi:hypothetical protein